MTEKKKSPLSNSGERPMRPDRSWEHTNLSVYGALGLSEASWSWRLHLDLGMYEGAPPPGRVAVASPSLTGGLAPIPPARFIDAHSHLHDATAIDATSRP